MPTPELGSTSDARGNLFKDPAFTENKSLPIHRWVPWIAGFSALFVSGVFKKYGFKPSDDRLVFDPFAGVSTTLVQCKLEGFDCAGVELNPYAALVSRVKLNWEIDLDALDKEVSTFRNYAVSVEKEFAQNRVELDHYGEDATGEVVLLKPKTKAPSGFRTREPFFDPPTQEKLLHLKEYISSQVSSEHQDLFRVGLGAVLVKYSNYSYGPSLGRKSVMKVKRVENGAIGRGLVEKLEDMRSDLRWLRSTIVPKLPRNPSHRFWEGSVFDKISQVDEDSVDLIVTSPPYLNNYHYPRNTRPHMYWLDFAEKPSDIEKIETQSFGTFWQTAREEPEIALMFRLASLEDVISKLRKTNPHKGIYGGFGWANYAATYFNDTYRFFSAIKPKMKRSGMLVWVLGNSILQGVEVKTEQFVAEISKQLGFTLEGVHYIREKRIGSSILRTNVRAQPAENGAFLNEAAVVMRT